MNPKALENPRKAATVSRPSKDWSIRDTVFKVTLNLEPLCAVSSPFLVHRSPWIYMYLANKHFIPDHVLHCPEMSKTSRKVQQQEMLYPLVTESERSSATEVPGATASILSE